ncbi:MAG: ribonuclease III [Anaerorhabdus sp.]
MKIEKWLENKDIKIENMQLVKQAFMHSSYANERTNASDNERLEFIGDAVLQLWSSNRIFNLDPPLNEGDMSTFRAQLVCEKSLSMYARKLGLEKLILLGNGEEKNGGRNKNSIIADMFEAFLGALYIDGGMKNVENILDEVITPYLKNPKRDIIIDYKTKLQEFVQADKRKTVSYEVLSIDGPPNQPIFEICVKLDRILLGVGKGNSKKKAEQNAAKNAFEIMVK